MNTAVSTTILLAIGAFVIFLLVQPYFENPFATECYKLNPKGFELVGGYELNNTIGCRYETPANKPFESCWIELQKTTNHGWVVSKQGTTCKTEVSR